MGRTLRLAALAVLPALPLAAGPLATVSALPEGARIVDVRPETACTGAAPAGARCLPASEVLGTDGTAPISFHALRWLLGTIGLAGNETVAVYPAEAARAGAVGALIHLAGQAEVVLLSGDAARSGRGETRGFSREVVFTAPMRIAAMRLDPDAPPLASQLSAFALGTVETVAIAPDA